MSVGQALPELATVPWRARTDARWLRRWQRVWHAWTLLYTIPFLAGAAGVLWVAPATPLSTPPSGGAAAGMLCLARIPARLAWGAAAHAWIIPELYAARGATV